MTIHRESALTQILVIEDSYGLLNEIIAILSSKGYEAIGAENGLIGLERAKERLPDLILCDVIMPVMDGYTMLLELRSDPNPAVSTIPFLFLTARSNRKDMRRGMELGADDFIMKPFTSQELIGAVETNLKKRKHLNEEYSTKISALRRSLVYALPKEIQMPLDSILNYANMLMEESHSLSPNQVQQLAEKIDQAAEQMHKIIESYLGFTRAEVIATQPTYIAQLRQEVTDSPCEIIKSTCEVKAYTTQRGDDLTWECENGSVLISREHLEKITSEILDNVIKLFPSGTPIIVKTVVEPDAFLLRVIIAHRGEGLNIKFSALQSSLFSNQSPKHAGTNLGMFTVKRLIDLYEGELVIDSVPENGTTITVRLKRPQQ